MSKRILGIIAVSAVVGCITLNCLGVGGYYFWTWYKDWTAPSDPQIVIQDMTIEGLKELQKQVQSELKYRNG